MRASVMATRQAGRAAASATARRTEGSSIPMNSGVIPGPSWPSSMPHRAQRLMTQHHADRSRPVASIALFSRCCTTASNDSGSIATRRCRPSLDSSMAIPAIRRSAMQQPNRRMAAVSALRLQPRQRVILPALAPTVASMSRSKSRARVMPVSPGRGRPYHVHARTSRDRYRSVNRAYPGRTVCLFDTNRSVAIYSESTGTVCEPQRSICSHQSTYILL